MNQGSGLAGKEPRSHEISPTPHAAPWPGDTSSLNPVQGHIFLAPPPGLQQGRTRLLLKLHSDKKFWLHPASGKITLNSNNWVLLGKTTSKQSLATALLCSWPAELFTQLPFVPVSWAHLPAQKYQPPHGERDRARTVCTANTWPRREDSQTAPSTLFTYVDRVSPQHPLPSGAPGWL